MANLTLSTGEYLSQVYERTKQSLAFRARNEKSWRRWHERLRSKVIELVGGFPQERCALDPVLVETNEMDGYRREKLYFQGEPGLSVPAYLLVPHGSGPHPGVVALHGHGAGVTDVLGEAVTEADANSIRDTNYDYAVQSARNGFVTIAIDQRAFGERREPRELAGDRRMSSCTAIGWRATELGRTLVGMRVWDVMRAIDYLESLPQVKAGLVGCIGLSGGGTTTLFSAALEDRIGATVISGYFCTFLGSIMAMDHCACNYVPHILKYAEMYDVAALIAPRPLLVEAGTQDDIFPIDHVKMAFDKVKKAYRLFGKEHLLQIDIFEGGHRWSGAKAFSFLREFL